MIIKKLLFTIENNDELRDILINYDVVEMCMMSHIEFVVEVVRMVHGLSNFFSTNIPYSSWIKKLINEEPMSYFLVDITSTIVRAGGPAQILDVQPVGTSRFSIVIDVD